MIYIYILFWCVGLPVYIYLFKYAPLYTCILGEGGQKLKYGEGAD